MDNWFKLYTTESRSEAAIIKGLLEDNHIEVMVLNKQDSSYLFGDIEIYVPIPFKELAQSLISHSLLN